MFSACLGNFIIFYFFQITILKLNVLTALSLLGVLFSKSLEIWPVVLILKFRLRRDLQKLQDYTPLPEI